MFDQEYIEKSKKRERKAYTLGVLLMLLITFSLFGGAYAFFTAIFTGVEDDTTITIGGGTLGIHMDGGNIITMNNIFPREEAWDTKRFTITGNNNTSLHMEYFLNLVVTENTFQNGSLTYTLESQNTSNTGTPIQSITTQRGIPTGAGVHSLGGGVFDEPGTGMSHTYYLTFFFPSRGVPQNEDQGATFRAHVGITGDGSAATQPMEPNFPDGSAGNEIVSNNPFRMNPDFTIVADNSNRETQEGIFRVEDDHGDAYIFRGTHLLNNNVIFAGHQWKILRIEGNGNIRMIYNGICTLNSEGTNCTEGINGNTAAAATTIGTSQFNTQAIHARFVGYMFGSETGTFNEQHANVNNSAVKTFVDNWFNNNITGDNRDRVANNTIFCVDRSIANQEVHTWFGIEEVGTGLGTEPTVYGTSGRVRLTGLPTLVCPRAEDRISLPVGLPSQDELNMAGGRGGFDNNDFFLRTNGRYWTISPLFNLSSNAIVRPVHVNGDIIGTTGIVVDSSGVRPVLSLNSDVVFARGNGSAATPFVVE